MLLGILAACLLPLAISLYAVAIPLISYVVVREDLNNYFNTCIEAVKCVAMLIMGVVTAPLNLIISMMFGIVYLVKR